MTRGFLRHEDLLDQEKYNPILSPRCIPVHPSVYRSDVAYTQEFYDEILRQLKSSVEEDVRVIGRILPAYRLGDVHELPLQVFHRSVDSAKKDIALGFSGSNIALCPGSHIERLVHDSHELPSSLAERLSEFSLTPDRLTVPVWYTHTPDQAGMEVYLYLRNFAILFNNLGIERVQKPS